MVTTTHSSDWRSAADAGSWLCGSGVEVGVCVHEALEVISFLCSDVTRLQDVLMCHLGMMDTC